MNQFSDRHRILIIDSGGGYGGNATFLRDFLIYLDKDQFQPFVAFYSLHVSPDTKAVQQMALPIFFLSRSQPLDNYLQEKLLARRSRWTWLHLAKVALHFILQLFLLDLLRLWRLLRILKTNHIDLIILNNDVHYHRVGALAARLTHLPCVCRKSGGIGEARRLKKILTPWIDLFIAISAATSQDQLQNNPGTKRVATVFEGVDLKRYVPGSHNSELRNELGISVGKKVVACVSRLVEGKGHREVVEAAASVVKSYKDVVFLVVGEGENSISNSLVKTLKARIHALGLSPYFIFTGWRTDIPEILSLADLFVHCPTTWLEGLGIAHLEAMAMGKPTVVSENGGLTEAALDGVTGFVVPPGDVDRLSLAILRLLNDHELAQRMGTNARKRIEELFDVRKSTRQMEMLIHEYFRNNRLRSKNRLTAVQQTQIT